MKLITQYSNNVYIHGYLSSVQYIRGVDRNTSPLIMLLFFMQHLFVPGYKLFKPFNKSIKHIGRCVLLNYSCHANTVHTFQYVCAMEFTNQLTKYAHWYHRVECNTFTPQIKGICSATNLTFPSPHGIIMILPSSQGMRPSGFSVHIKQTTHACVTNIKCITYIQLL